MEIQAFRNYVDENVRDEFENYLVKFLYLTGCRHNEACYYGYKAFEKLRPRKKREDGSMPELHPLTRPVGPTKANVSYDWYQTPNIRFLLNYGNIPVAKIKMNVLKRKAKNQVTRIVAFPLDARFEPWGAGVKSQFDSISEGPLIPSDIVKVCNILHKYDFYEIAKELVGKDWIDNPLRHIRYTHLIDYYGFGPWEAPLFMGHKLETALSGSGGPADNYASLAWQMYFPALLKPLPNSSLQNTPIPNL